MLYFKMIPGYCLPTVILVLNNNCTSLKALFLKAYKNDLYTNTVLI
jgi:hypothetical protein